MAVSLKHTFQSAKSDGVDSTLVQPSNWNAEHTLSLTTNKLLGRSTAGTGAAEEISIGTGLSLSAGVLSSSTSFPISIANGGTNGTATPTAGAVPYGTGTAYAFTSAGTTGQVLTSAGSGVPTWTTPSAGAMTLISTQVITSAATVSWTGLSGYDRYFLAYENVTTGSTGGDYIGLQFGTGSTPTYTTANYLTFSTYLAAGYSPTGMANSSYASSMWFGYNTTTTMPNWGELFIYGMTAGIAPAIDGKGSFGDTSGTVGNINSSGSLPGSTATQTAIRIRTYGSANITGRFSLYGISS